jgi:hypothetical protein
VSYPQKVVRAAYGAVSKLLEMQLRGVGDEADDDAAEPTDRAAYLQPLGLAVLPVVARTLRAWVEQSGDEPHVTRLWNKAATPTDLESGETRLYAAGTITNALRLLAGAAVLEAPSVKLGAAATKKVNREGDAIRPGSLTISATTSTLTITYTAPDGGGTQSASIAVGGSPAVFTPATTTITLAGKTGAGSDKVRAED